MTSIDRQTRRAVLTGALAAGLGLAAAPAPAAAAAPLRRFAPSGSGSVPHAEFDAILKRHVRPDGAGYNRVDYRAMKTRSHAALAAYLAALQAARPSAFSAAAAHAYWINLYNAATLHVVLEHYPVASIRDIDLGGGLFASGPWSKRFLAVEGQALSLDDIEHRIVRPLFADPMSHYALNCASYSCPNLAAGAYTAGNLGALMAAGAAAYVNHPRGVAVSRGTIAASKIYSWYAEDFGGRPRLKRHWQAHAAPRHAAAIGDARIGRFRYDWSLNDV